MLMMDTRQSTSIRSRDPSSEPRAAPPGFSRDAAPRSSGSRARTGMSRRRASHGDSASRRANRLQDLPLANDFGVAFDRMAPPGSRAVRACTISLPDGPRLSYPPITVGGMNLQTITQSLEFGPVSGAANLTMYPLLLDADARRAPCRPGRHLERHRRQGGADGGALAHACRSGDVRAGPSRPRRVPGRGLWRGPARTSPL